MIRCIVIALLISMLSSCSEKEPIYPISHYYKLKKEELRVEQKKECKQKAIDNASSHIDAVIDRMVDKRVMDTLNFPNKPNRPTRPEDLIKPEDQE